MKFRVTASWGLRLREAPTNGRIMGIVPFDAPVEVFLIEGGWAKVAVDIRAGDAPVSYPSPAIGWLSAEFLKADFVPPPPISLLRPLALGFNVISNGRSAQNSLTAGCKAVTIINDFLFGTQLVMGGATVIKRRWLPSRPNFQSGEQLADDVYEGGRGGGYFAPIFNEGDVVGQDVAGIRERASYDRMVAPVIKARGGIYCAGGFSVGCPDFTDQAVCDAIRAEYAVGYNRGDYAFLMHLYSPLAFDAAGNLVPISIWHGRRWEFLFTKCGFSPDPKLLGVVSDETGEDEGGVGGFRAHGRTPAQVGRWYRAFASASREALVIGGVAYPSPLRVACGFQLGDTSTEQGHWGGYDQSEYVAEVVSVAQEAYSTEVTRTLDARRTESGVWVVDRDEPAPAPLPFVRKVLRLGDGVG